MARDCYGYTPLHLASFDSGAGAIRSLIEAGADPNAKDNYSRATPLHIASGRWYYDASDLHEIQTVVSTLLHGNDDPNARDKDGESPLHSAARYADRAPVIATLLSAGADANVRTSPE